MAWVTCPHCGFTQISALDCLRCGRRIDTPSKEPAPPGQPPRGVGARSAGLPIAARSGIALVGAAALLVAIVLFLTMRPARSVRADPAARAATPEPWTLDLTGSWRAKATTTIASSPPRPALREVVLETDASGNLVAVSAVLTDPGRGGAGAGYVTVPDGRRRIQEISQALSTAPDGAALALDFIPLPGWVPRRERLWRGLEGMRHTPEETTYLLVESVERDYLIQAGVNASGFLSYVYLSPEYASGRGTDVLSRVIHPGSENSLRGFRNVVWDLSGAADFVGLQIHASISEPAGALDRLVLRR